MKTITIKENRKDLFAGIISMLIISPLVIGFTYTLIKNANVFSNNYHLQFIILVSLMLIASKDALTMLLILCTKFISPYYIAFDQNGFYDCKLKQHINWNKINRIEYLNYKTTFLNKKCLLEYVIYMLTFKNTIGIITEIIKYFILSSLDASKSLVIITNNKKEILKNAGFFKKLESRFMPDNVVKINIEPSCCTHEDLMSVIKSLQIPNKIT